MVVVLGVVVVGVVEVTVVKKVAADEYEDVVLSVVDWNPKFDNGAPPSWDFPVLTPSKRWFLLFWGSPLELESSSSVPIGLYS